MKLKIQVGVENFEHGIRKVRLTPVSITETVPDSVGQILLMLESVFDAGDSQRGDGEIDVPVGALSAKIEAMWPWITKATEFFHSGVNNVFLRIAEVK